LTTDEVLLGVVLIVALAVGSQVLASRLRIPAIILLLPAGFTAGAITTDVNPQRLLGPPSSRWYRWRSPGATSSARTPGLIAAIVMGLAVANLRGFDVPARRPFFETLVQTRPARARPLLVGGDDWVIDLGRHQVRAEQALRRRRADLRAARRRYGQRRR
jgi:hypothetical protein